LFAAQAAPDSASLEPPVFEAFKAHGASGAHFDGLLHVFLPASLRHEQFGVHPSTCCVSHPVGALEDHVVVRIMNVVTNTLIKCAQT
jgi:hypothetical protein